MGKSSIYAETAKRLGYTLYDVRVSGRDPVDLLGMPQIVDGLTRFCAPAFLPRKKGKSILFLDEINRGTQMLLNLGLQLVLDGRCGDYVLPEGCVVMAAGNPETDPGVIRMSSAMRLRFSHLDLELHHDQWAAWAIKNNIDPMVIAFVRFRPELLHNFDFKARVSPNPRGWEFVSKLLTELLPDMASPTFDTAILQGMVEGNVGKAAGIEFAGFSRLHKNLPSIDAILLDPNHTQVPKDPGAMYAVSSALARRASPTNLGRIMTYLQRMPVEYDILAIKTAIGRNNGELSHTPEYTKWAVAHADATF